VIARLLLTVVVVAVSARSDAQEACEQDDTDLVNQLEENLVFETARTAEDFLNESLRHFFTSFEGNRDFTLLLHSSGSGFLFKAFVSLDSEHSVSYVACNDIGQCAQGEVTVHFSKYASREVTEAANSVLDFLSGGQLSLGRVFSTGWHKYVVDISTGDGDQSTAEVTEGTPRQILTRPDEFPVREEGDPLTTDERCRNNHGELLEDEPVAPSGGGGFNPPTMSQGTQGYSLRVHSGWLCYPDATGVVCKMLYDYVWVDL
jgi:hypothetical protein